MARPATTDEQVIAQWGVVPVGDVVLDVRIAGEVIGRLDVYWHTVKVGRRKPIPVAWFDHLWIDPNYENMGFGPGLLAAGKIAAAREVEWGAGYSPRTGFFEAIGWLSPEDAADHLLVWPLTGLPQTWPPGKIAAVPPSVED